MSDWRRAGNLAPARTAWSRPAALKWPESRLGAPARTERGRIATALGAVRVRHVVVLAALIAYPFVVPPFFTFQIGGQTLALGLIALSLSFLAGYGGMVSLAQMTVAGIAGYVYAIFGTTATTDGLTLGWPWWAASLMAIPIATLAATLIGWLSVRTEGIYTIMITLAAGMAFYYLVHQNISIFGGFTGFQAVAAPEAFGIYWRDPLPFYFLSLACALGGYVLIKYTARAPFGVALQGIRDNPRRMAALGFNVTMHRIAAYTLAGFLAAIGGLLLVWYNALVAPGSVDTKALIIVLIIAVLGGFAHPIGPFIGAAIFVLLQNFAIDVVDRLSGGLGLRDRFNLVIGGVFLLIVLFSPDGLLGWWTRLRRRFETAQERSDPRAGR